MLIEELSKSEVEDLVSHFQGTTESDIAETLLNSIDSILNQNSIGDTLGKPERGMVDMFEKLIHARSMLSPDLYSIIGEVSMLNPDMTFDKIRTIGIAEPGINPDKYSRGGIDKELIRALGGEIIADKRITVEKLTLFQNGATPKWIQDKIQELGEEGFLNMSIPDIAMELF